ncbi:hypothetical protein EII28_07110 [Fusobacterium nucleatum]|jgi:hypothetical protein|uniref:Lipoprotein n=1 Tax=Fusobacterium nucleatum TaxID=851 RepID=A0A3P1VUZ0_FUSNU|nr:hypothetical protein [Fusobacterium nucleatum]RRD37130.1 hypothetical protein EII28_07110 [Fusobacterium nucleatum]
MKLIKKIFLIVLALFTFTACTSTVNFKTNVAPVKASQQTVIVANYPDNWADARDILNTNLRYDGWKVTNMNFWKVEEINFKQRKETFLITIDKLRKSGEGFFGGTLFDGNIRVYDLRTGALIIDHRLYSDELYEATNGIVKALSSLVVK